MVKLHLGGVMWYSVQWKRHLYSSIACRWDSLIDIIDILLFVVILHVPYSTIIYQGSGPNAQDENKFLIIIHFSQTLGYIHIVSRCGATNILRGVLVNFSYLVAI